MIKFKVGDKVRFANKRLHDVNPINYPEYGTVGKITSILNERKFFVEWPAKSLISKLPSIGVYIDDVLEPDEDNSSLNTQKMIRLKEQQLQNIADALRDLAERIGKNT